MYKEVIRKIEEELKKREEKLIRKDNLIGSLETALFICGARDEVFKLDTFNPRIYGLKETENVSIGSLLTFSDDITDDVLYGVVVDGENDDGYLTVVGRPYIGSKIIHRTLTNFKLEYIGKDLWKSMKSYIRKDFFDIYYNYFLKSKHSK